MKPTVLGMLLVFAIVSLAEARIEGAFRKLSDLVDESDYVVIATVLRKDPANYMDGWVKYEFRFAYWLKVPEADLAGASKLQEAIVARRRDEVKPLPLFEYDYDRKRNRDYPAFPPGAPHTNAVLLVDDHEKGYNRLTPVENDIEQLPMRKLGDAIMSHHNYHILFLKKPDRLNNGDTYVTVGTYQSILPVSPLLDMMKLPGEPYPSPRMASQPPANPNVEETIRFIVKDYIKFKEQQLGEIKKDLEEVLQDKEPPKPAAP